MGLGAVGSAHEWAGSVASWRSGLRRPVANGSRWGGGNEAYGVGCRRGWQIGMAAAAASGTTCCWWMCKRGRLAGHLARPLGLMPGHADQREAGDGAAGSAVQLQQGARGLRGHMR